METKSRKYNYKELWRRHLGGSKMYIDLIVLILLILVVIMFFKNYQSFVFLIAIIDIFLRILSFIKSNIGLNDVSYIIGKYFPDSIFDIIHTFGV